MKWLSLSRRVQEAREQAEFDVLNDFRFEHLGAKGVSDAVWRFIVRVTLGLRESLAAFILEHSRESQRQTFFFPVEFLEFAEPRLFGEVELLPRDHQGVPTELFLHADRVDGVVAVEAEGTDGQRMRERAHVQALHALRQLRIQLRKGQTINERQLHFRLGNSFATSGGGRGWSRSRPFELTLNAELARLISEDELLPSGPRNDLDSRALTALRWIDRAMTTPDRLLEVLYYFFALEALLGRKSDKRKGEMLAFRRVFLGHLASGSFTHPNELFVLYDQVRSAAVHGEEEPELPEKMYSFGWTVRLAFCEFLKLARDNSFQTRKRLLKFMAEHPDRQQAIDWFHAQGGIWQDFQPESG